MSVNVDLDSNQEAFVQELIASGRLWIGCGGRVRRLRLIQELETLSPELEEKLARGIADADAGRAKPVDEVFDRLDPKYEAISAADGNTRGTARS